MIEEYNAYNYTRSYMNIYKNLKYVIAFTFLGAFSTTSWSSAAQKNMFAKNNAIVVARANEKKQAEIAALQAKQKPQVAASLLAKGQSQ